jgi:hypothetical protein
MTRNKIIMVLTNRTALSPIHGISTEPTRRKGGNSGRPDEEETGATAAPTIKRCFHSVQKLRSIHSFCFHRCVLRILCARHPRPRMARAGSLESPMKRAINCTHLRSRVNSITSSLPVSRKAEEQQVSRPIVGSVGWLGEFVHQSCERNDELADMTGRSRA